MAGLGLTGVGFAAQPDFEPRAQAATPAPVATALTVFNAATLPDSVTLARRMEPAAVALGQEAETHLTLTGHSDAGCLGIPGSPVDAIIVFDISTSAGIGPGSNWEHTSALTQALLDQLDEGVYRALEAPPETSQIGLVGSQTGTQGPEPFLVQPLTSDFALLRTQAGLLSPSGDTDVAAGLLLAASELAKTSDGRARAIVLMLHDNAPINPNTQAALNQVAEQGIPVHVIVNSLNQAPEQQITAELAAQMAPVAGIYLDPTPQQLRELFVAVSGGDISIAARVLLTEIFLPAGTAELPGMLDTFGQIRTDEVRWTFDIRNDETLDLGYRWRLAGAGNLSIQSNMAWLDCNGHLYTSFDGFEGTPMPAGTPVSITAQPTDTSLVSTPTPGPTRTPTGGGVVGKDDGGGLWGWVTPAITALSANPAWLWLLLIPLVLWLLWLLWRWWRNRKVEKITRPPDVHGDPPPQEPQPVKELKPGDLTDLWQPSPGDKLLAEDGSGRELRLWASPAAATLRSALAAGQEGALDLDLNTRENAPIAGAVLAFELQEEINPLLARTDRWYRARLRSLTVERNVKPGLQRQAYRLLLDQVEALARRFQAREVYSALPDEDIRSLLEAKGYLTRTGAGVDSAQHYKDLTPASGNPG